MKNLILIVAGLLSASSVMAQNGGLTDMSKSKFSQMSNTPLGAVKWTGGFWGERFGVYSNTSLQSMWNTWNNPDISHGFRNFEIAAGDCQGEHWGPPFHDGDMYKWLEGVASVGNGVFASSLISVFAPKTSTGMPTVECSGEDGKLHVSVHLSVFYGYPFTKLAADVRQAVNAAVEEQIGVPAESVDVCIDNLVFPKE